MEAAARPGISKPASALSFVALPRACAPPAGCAGVGRSGSPLWLTDRHKSWGSQAPSHGQSIWKNHSPHPGHKAPTGTLCRSPFHADIFRSFSWSVNICGRKKWFLFPPGQEEALRDCHGGLPYDVTAPAFLESRPHLGLNHCSPPLEVMQEAGEMVFVPSGWHHQVHNMVGWAHPAPHAQELAQASREIHHVAQQAGPDSLPTLPVSLPLAPF